MGHNYTMIEFAKVMTYVADSDSNHLDVGSFMYAFLTPFALSALVPAFTYTIVHEKQQRLREMMKMMGMEMRTYWTVNFVYDAIVYTFVAAVYGLVGRLFGIRALTQVDTTLQFLLFSGWGVAQIALSFILSCFFSTSRSATIGSYMFVTFSCLTSFVFSLALWPVDQDKEAHWSTLMYPPWAAFRAYAIIGLKCWHRACPSQVEGELLTCVSVLWATAPLMLGLALALDRLVPQQYGVRLHPLDAVARLLRRKRDSQRDVEAGVDMEAQDPDVAQEAAVVDKLAACGDVGARVVVRDLRKSFGSGRARKDALRGVTLHVGADECLGLLGPNGAGKTTMISLLTGVFEPSSGSATVCGYDVFTEMADIHKIVGVCPQFDYVWPELSPYETLLFYSRMRGISGKDAHRSAAELLKAVGLEMHGSKKVQELSGGMRRRLSIAIALVGDPKVIFLDEPTTGLDVMTRRQLWDVLQMAQLGRTTILTTHSMEEADALCQRIAVVADGKLRAVGTNVHLKDRFGGGYSVHASFDPHDEPRVDNFIQSIVAPHSKVTEAMTGLKTYRLPAGANVAMVFGMMVDSAAHGVVNWGITQSTLEDVFLALVDRRPPDSPEEQAGKGWRHTSSFTQSEEEGPALSALNPLLRTSLRTSAQFDDPPVLQQLRLSSLRMSTGEV
eukprot:m51a1_g12684 hypothetical protein (671) ;mRNA; f:126-2366